MENYEKLGAFYLGKAFDIAAGEVRDDLVMYDAKDLTTHAVCVGMTGSGKTGLCVSLLEEAAIDGVPALVIDPKGDIGNLLLTFPNLAPDDFRPWIDERDAARQGKTPDEFAADRAELWRTGLADWGQDGERIQRFRDAVDLAIYTPGSSAGLPLRVLKSFDAPPRAVIQDDDAMRERIDTTVSGVLGLLKIDADPVSSREHILLCTILDRAWREGTDLGFADVIAAIQQPDFDTLGVIDVDSFFPPKDRFALAMKINNLLASPVFSAWTKGEPLDIDRLLYTESGKPRVSILSIAHLSDEERMFFVTLVLNEVVTWMRAQPGTSSLRALLYMDEVFGFLPPVSQPPSKKPMLTLLKQARAFGLGTVLATQNPVDLDYKALSNAGTWFLGRLQTERDKLRVLEGLEGASATAGAAFDRKAMDQILAGLKSRVFVMNNVHEDGPALFHTRWAMSYLRGPLSRDHIKTLMADRVQATEASSSPEPRHTSGIPRSTPTPHGTTTSPPIVEPGVSVGYLPIEGKLRPGERLVYRPMLLVGAKLHYVRVAARIDEWRDLKLLVPLLDEPDLPWDEAITLRSDVDTVDEQPVASVAFSDLPSDASQERSYRGWARDAKDHLYREREMVIYHCKRPKLYSSLGETERGFRIRLRDLLHESRDEAIDTLRDKYAARARTLNERIRKAEQRVEVERSQYRHEQVQAAATIGEKLLGMLLGRKSRKSTLARASRAAKQRGDIGRAKENVAALEQDVADLDRALANDIDELHEAHRLDNVEILEITLRPRKGSLAIDGPALAWAACGIDETGRSRSLFTVEQ
mgnify:CR=1 FL=1